MGGWSLGAWGLLGVSRASQRHPHRLQIVARCLFLSIENSTPTAQIQFYNTPASLDFCLSSWRESFTVASSKLSHWTSPLRTIFTPSAAQPEPNTLITQIFDLLESHPATSYTTLFATLLALIFLVVKYFMSTYGYRSHLGDSRRDPGRHSPYTSYLASQTSNLSDFIEYIGHDTHPHHYGHDRADHDYHRPSIVRPHNRPLEADDAPDVLILKHRGQHYELLFIPYAISDGKLYVQDVRHYAAEKLRAQPHRVKLAYKGNRLTNDNWQARDYGLKQNSEITVVISEAGGDSPESSHASDDDSGSGVSTGRSRRDHESSLNDQPRHPRRRGMSTARHRSEVEVPQMAAPSAFLHPNSAGAGVSRQSRPAERSSGDSLASSSEYYPESRLHRASSRSRREPSRTRRDPSPAPPEPSRSHEPPRTRQSPPHDPYRESNGSIPMPAPPAPSRSAGPPPPVMPLPAPSVPADNSPAGRLAALTSDFRNHWSPRCEHFIASPPSDPAVREKEYKVLSESVLAQIILRADDIQAEGDMEIRKMRKALVNDANALLKRLDKKG